MAKKFLLAILFSVFGLSLSAAFAFAQIGTNPSTSVTPTYRTLPATRPAKDAMQMQDKKTAMQDAIAEKKAAFRERLALIKDTQKQAVVERIDSKLTTLNTRLTTVMSNALMMLTARLTMLEEKGAEEQANGKDTTQFDLAVTSAKAAIETATEAVNSQKEKDYTVTITTETQLRTTVGQTVKTAQSDLRATHALVQAAKKAVVNVAVELAKLNRTMADTDTASPSAN